MVDVGNARAGNYKAFYFDEKRSQVDMCLEYLNLYGEITPLEALMAFGCLRLASIICKLRKRGYQIDTFINEDGKRYAVYVLRREK